MGGRDRRRVEGDHPRSAQQPRGATSILTYLLDTNTIIARLNGDTRVARRLREVPPEQVVLCAPVLAELEFGAWCSARRDENLGRLHRIAASMRFEAFDRSAAQRFGKLKAALRKLGLVKSDFDLSMAAIALELGLVLVSDDHAFFDESIPDLRAENWLRETV